MNDAPYYVIRVYDGGVMTNDQGQPLGGESLRALSRMAQAQCDLAESAAHFQAQAFAWPQVTKADSSAGAVHE